MQIKNETERPIYIEIASLIEDAILSEAFEEETQIPSTTELSVKMKINPATALKGINMLVDQGIIYKKRGLGMFVSKGSAEKILKKRKEEFFEAYINSLVDEARKLKLPKAEIISMIERGFDK
ncbi:MAG: GntR family transcriptional regulator [Oscillospiraceae bacterium]|jgi:DNA-binding transcriptional regulator YhcF (GntR family)